MYVLASRDGWKRISVESNSKYLVRIAHGFMLLAGFKRKVTGVNAAAKVVWTYDKGECPYEQE